MAPNTYGPRIKYFTLLHVEHLGIYAVLLTLDGYLIIYHVLSINISETVVSLLDTGIASSHCSLEIM